MKILLLGEYSDLHWTLAEGLRAFGHHVTVASDGDGFKNYERNIDLFRKSSSIKDTSETLFSVIKNLKNFKGYDVVQLINPCFTQLNVNVNKYLYRFLRRNNKRVFLGAFGDDSIWFDKCMDKNAFRYSEFYIDGKENKYTDTTLVRRTLPKESYVTLNKEVADTCDGIIACLYEYYISYLPHYSSKLTFIPLPINLDKIKKTDILNTDKIRFFIGINRARRKFKGSDRLYDSLLKVYSKYPDKIELIIAESVPYAEYLEMFQNSDVVLDQLYSYSPAMNGLLTLAEGKILVSGGEPEMYELLNEDKIRPIINVYPSDEDIFNKLEHIVLNRDKLLHVSDDGRLFVEKHHDYKVVAQQYLDFWRSKGAN